MWNTWSAVALVLKVTLKLIGKLRSGDGDDDTVKSCKYSVATNN